MTSDWTAPLFFTVAMVGCSAQATPATTPSSGGTDLEPVQLQPRAAPTSSGTATGSEVSLTLRQAPSDEPSQEPREPVPFAGAAEVTVEDLISELEKTAVAMAELEVVRSDYRELVVAHELADTPELYRDYVRVRLAFELTRDGGAWHLTWTITNQKPRSDAIWEQWDAFELPTAGSEDNTSIPDDAQVGTTAFAECDELSALFAFVARRLGVDRIGLFWPTWNHVVAVWTVDGADGESVRVVVPTSQIFLGENDTLGTTSFDPWRQKTIFTYKRRDVSLDSTLPVPLARFFVRQAASVVGLDQDQLQALRNQRSARLGGS